jgi:hypothetical protein
MRPNLQAACAWLLVAALPLSAATPPAAPRPGTAPAVPDKALFDSDDLTIVKKSREGVCHDATSAGFAQTLHYRAYRNLKDCLDSGGRRPR